MTKIKLTKNPEVFQLFRAVALLLAGFMIFALLIGWAGRTYLKKRAINSYASIVGIVAAEYPLAEEKVIEDLTAPAEKSAVKGKAILSKYGIQANRDLQDFPDAQNNFYFSLATGLLPALLFCGALIILLLGFLGDYYSRIRELTRYAGRISAADYSLDLRDNREGDLSILKNEVFKITTALKEQAEIMKNEKSLLADSLADISHQLKTPLTSLSVLNDLLSENPEEEKRALFLERMRAQLDRIEWLIGSLLKLSKLDAGAVILKKEIVSVPALIGKALGSLSIPLEIKAVQVHIVGDDGVSFQGDFGWSSEALINILKNCIEHTPENSHLDIRFYENPLYTSIRISDGGRGIPENDLPHIFTRFYKGKNAPEDRVGIGLAMARSIVEKQGGDLSAENKPGQGAEFTIKFYNQPRGR